MHNNTQVVDWCQDAVIKCNWNSIQSGKLVEWRLDDNLIGRLQEIDEGCDSIQVYTYVDRIVAAIVCVWKIVCNLISRNDLDKFIVLPTGVEVGKVVDHFSDDFFVQNANVFNQLSIVRYIIRIFTRVQ